MVIQSFSCPILIASSIFGLGLCERDVKLDSVTSRVRRDFGSAPFSVRLGLLEVDLVYLVFVVIVPRLLHRPERIQLKIGHVCL